MRQTTRFAKNPWLLLVLVLGVNASPAARGHGGVVLEDDLCLINIGFYQGHFTIYQPRSRGHEQYCEDLPDVGESIFVLEFLHDGLQDLPLDFRIVKNTTGLGLFAGWQDVQALDDIEAVTVFYQPPMLEPDVLTLMHTFDAAGDYIGIVTATNPETGTLYNAVFPFEVGFYGINYEAIAVGVTFVVPLLLLAVALRRRMQLRRIAAAAMVSCAALLTAPVDARAAAPDATLTATTALHRISVSPSLQPIVINRIHSWEISLTDARGNAVTNASIVVGGGMPEHDHGLPTRPRMTRNLGAGRYLIEGMKFHMGGRWQIDLQITVAGRTDVARIDLTL